MAFLKCSRHGVQLVLAHGTYTVKGRTVTYSFYRCPVKGCETKRADKHGLRWRNIRKRKP